MPIDGIVNVADVREATCHIWIERGWRMPSAEIIDYAYANGFASNYTIVPSSKIETMEEAYLALEKSEICFEHERILELLALDEQ